MGSAVGTTGESGHIGVGPLTYCALWWMAGVALGHAIPDAVLWLGAAVVLTAALGLLLATGRGRAARLWGVVGLLVVAAGWTVVSEHRLPRNSVQRFIAGESQLVQVTGIVDSLPTFTQADDGAFAPFSYRAPVTLFALDLQTLQVGAVQQPVSGMLLVKIEQIDHRLRGGQRIRATGWISRIEEPVNPGEHDYYTSFKQRGIVGRLTLRDRGNWQSLDNEHTRLAWRQWRQGRAALGEAASRSLRAGMGDDSERLAFLDAILLGRRNGELADTYDSFRRVGLAHLLSISGAHLGILLGLVWLTARLITPLPVRAAMAVLVVLGLFMFVVPLETPIVRAAIMAGLFALMHASGRRVRAIETLATAAILILIWRPSDLFSAGFQLSFGAVAALILLTRPVSDWLYPPPVIDHNRTWQEFRLWSLRGQADSAAVSIVASCVVLPLVAFHFQLITPWAAALSIVAVPAVTALLAVGYLKIVLGLLLPSAGALLAHVLGPLTDFILASVQWMARWDSVAIALPRPPSAAWTLGAVLLMVAIFTGCFATRRKALVASLALCTLWLALDVQPSWARRLNLLAAPPPPLTLNMLAVGDGSCYLVRTCGLDEQGKQRRHVLMFDCGSQMYFDAGIKSIRPALAQWGVDRIDTLLLSHADMDHFSAAIDVADGVSIGRVLMPPQMFAEASARPGTATGFLIQGLRQRNIPIALISKGWHETHGGIAFDLLWPPADYPPDPSNDASAVLSVRAATRRILLCGDIQQQAMTALLEQGADCAADVCDIPHHGSYVPAAPAFLTRVSPYVVLQSSGPGRLYQDKWQAFFAGVPVERLITARSGMVEVRIEGDGALDWDTFRK